MVTAPLSSWLSLPFTCEKRLALSLRGDKWDERTEMGEYAGERGKERNRKMRSRLPRSPNVSWQEFEGRNTCRQVVVVGRGAAAPISQQATPGNGARDKKKIREGAPDDQ